ncbi:MAG: DNA polymerase III subunit alpha, partial [Bacteroidota bacterium]
GYHTHRILRAIDQNTLLTKLKKSDHADERDRLYPIHQLQQHYQLYPQIIENTTALLDQCSIAMSSTLKHNRQTFSGSKTGDLDLLRKLTRKGWEKRYQSMPAAWKRIEQELAVIETLDFCCYFLITWDIIRYAKSMGYHHVGRGSGANSIVAYCLFITDVEPMELALYFERFMNKFRSSPPDFDIDFSWDERDDVIDYIFKRYGKDHTALLATYHTFQKKSTLREVGKVFGLPKAEIDLLIEEPEATAQHHGLAKYVFQYGEKIAGLPNHLSIHAGGILIAEQPLYHHTALQRMPKGVPIVHFDMYGAEALGFHKYDVLSQRGLGHIKDSIALIQQNQNHRIDIHDLERIKQDQRVKQLLKSGHCMGCFYIESPAMRGLLQKLQCEHYVHLVAASSIIRPGVAKSGMMRTYIKRFHDPSKVVYLHEVFEEHLKETYGVMVYQEDVMKIIHHFAGLDLDESDVLRRIMKGKRKSNWQFEQLKAKYFANCKQRAYPEKLIQEVWRQIESFSGYSFCKAHSASFAAESFQSLFLKAYYPLEFMVAVINNFGGFYRTEYYFHEARMNGATIHAPCVNQSQHLTTINGTDIYMGFIHLKQLERKISTSILDARKDGGSFSDLEDFTTRVAITGEQLELLIRIDAFRFTGKTKYEMMWEKSRVFNPSAEHHRTGLLFGETTKTYALPELEYDEQDAVFDQIDLLGFPLSSPFDLIKNAEQYAHTLTTKHFAQHIGQCIAVLGYFVTKKEVQTVNHKRMYFGTWIDRAGIFFDTTHFPSALQNGGFRGKGVYLITGKIVEDFGVLNIEVTAMKKCGRHDDALF